MAGNSVGGVEFAPTEIVCNPAGRLKLMTFGRPVVLALESMIACRNEPAPESAVLLTVNTVINTRSSTRSKIGREKERDFREGPRPAGPRLVFIGNSPGEDDSRTSVQIVPLIANRVGLRKDGQFMELSLQARTCLSKTTTPREADRHREAPDYSGSSPNNRRRWGNLSFWIMLV